MIKKNLNKEVQKSDRLTKQLSIDRINQEIANNWHFLSDYRKAKLRDLIIDTWNSGARFSTISKSNIKVPNERTESD